jgi:hypothetical protein
MSVSYLLLVRLFLRGAWDELIARVRSIGGRSLAGAA